MACLNTSMVKEAMQMEGYGVGKGRVLVNDGHLEVQVEQPSKANVYLETSSNLDSLSFQNSCLTV